MKKKKELTKSEVAEDKKEISVIVEAMLDKKAKNVVSLDLRKIGTSISDYFVVCNADSTTQVVAISDNVEGKMEELCGRGAIRKQGRENAFWVILDFANIVVHIFKSEYRDFYRLEDLWDDAVKTNYEDE